MIAVVGFEGVTFRPMCVRQSDVCTNLPMFGGLARVCRAPIFGGGVFHELNELSSTFGERAQSTYRPSSPHPVVTDTDFASYGVQKSALWV